MSRSASPCGGPWVSLAFRDPATGPPPISPSGFRETDAARRRGSRVGGGKSDDRPPIVLYYALVSNMIGNKIKCWRGVCPPKHAHIIMLQMPESKYYYIASKEAEPVKKSRRTRHLIVETTRSIRVVAAVASKHSAPVRKESTMNTATTTRSSP
jgi:hypothetical protein